MDKEYKVNSDADAVTSLGISNDSKVFRSGFPGETSPCIFHTDGIEGLECQRRKMQSTEYNLQQLLFSLYLIP